MSKNKTLAFPLDIQLFAEGDQGGDGGNGGTANTQTTQSTTSQTAIDYTKIEDIVNKRSSNASESAVKGYLKEQGLSGDELNDAVKQYKTAQALKAKEEQEKASNLVKENAALKAQIMNASIDSKVSELSAGMGVSAEKLPFLQKMVDRSKASKEDGSLNDEEIKKAIEDVLKAFPDFKGDANSQQGGFQQIGSAGSTAGGTAIDAALDAAFGVKK